MMTINFFIKCDANYLYYLFFLRAVIVLEQQYEQFTLVHTNLFKYIADTARWAVDFTL